MISLSSLLFFSSSLPRFSSLGTEYLVDQMEPMNEYLGSEADEQDRETKARSRVLY